jgi:DMSO/TMAO reductase YedYZ heme-binding membrane subunit
MGIGASIFLIAVGAILAFAVDVDTEGFNLDTIGVILMIVGAIGLLMSMLFWTDWAPYRRRRVVDVDDRPVVRRRVYDDDVL